MLITCIIVPCSRIHDIWLFLVTDVDFPILDMRAVDMRYVESHIYCSCYIVLVILFMLYCSRYSIPDILFPIPVILFYAINRAQVQLSCYPYHVLYLFLLHCILNISDHKANLGMGETRRLIRSYRVMYWIHIVSPTAGDGVVLATVCYSWAPVSRYCFSSLRFPLHVTALAGWSWSQQPGVW